MTEAHWKWRRGRYDAPVENDDLLQQSRAAFAAGEFDAALAHASALVQRGYQGPDALVLLVNAATRVGALEDAIFGLERLLARFPDNVQFRRMLSTAYNNRGTRRTDDRQAACADYARAVDLWPKNTEALFNLGRAEHRAGRLDAALVALRSAHALVPADGEVRRTLAQCEIETAQILAQGGDILAARAAFAHAAMRGGRGAESPSLHACIAERLALPGVYASRDELDRRRREYSDGLDRLIEEFDEARLAVCAPRLEQVAWSNFLLAYQGEDDRNLQARYGDWLARATRAFAPDLVEPPPRPRQRRIGLLSSFFRDSTVGAYFASWVGALTHAGFETIVFQLGPLFDGVTESIGASATRLVRLEGALEELARAVHGAELDLLIFPELGMDARVFALAALRLAPVQAMAWGHPVTSGLPSIDFFFTCADMEPEAAAAHYRERVIRLPGLGTAYARPQLPPPAGRADLGLPAGHLYLVPQAAFKIHPDTDAVLAEIAATDSDARLVLFENERAGMTMRLLARLDRALHARGADPSRQIVVLPMCDRGRFLAINRVCDLMIDSLHWSGGNTSLDALAMGLPVVTCPGRLMRGRQSAAMLARLGLAGELVVDDATRLARRAVALATNPEARNGLRRTIEARHEALYEGGDALAALVEAVETLLSQERTFCATGVPSYDAAEKGSE